MPRIFEIGRYVIYFWSNENGEPIHVHIGTRRPSQNSTKIWLTKRGGCIVAHNKSRIPKADLIEIMGVIEDNFFLICDKWKIYFDEDTIDFYA